MNNTFRSWNAKFPNRAPITIIMFGLLFVIGMSLACNAPADDEALKEGEGRILDQRDDYELVRIRLTDEILGNYLKMKNPSIGTFHMEGVPPEIETVTEALSWRNHGLEGDPEILS